MSRLSEPFAEISGNCFLRIAWCNVGPTSFSSSICHHGLNTAPEGDAFNQSHKLIQLLCGTSPELSANVSAMPELPEVETFKRYLDSTSLHQRITNVEVRDAYVLKRVSARELARRLKGRRFENSHRHGKHLFVRAGDELWLRLHFGMTGSLQYLKRDEETPKTARVIFRFANNRRLAFDDQRKFGEIELIKDMDEFLQTRGIGPDALDVSSLRVQNDL